MTKAEDMTVEELLSGIQQGMKAAARENAKLQAMSPDERWAETLKRNKPGGPAWQHEEERQPEPTGEVRGMKCAEPGCDGTLRLRWSPRLTRWFYGCSRYPACNGTLPADKAGAPRGKPRTKELQGWRNQAHKVFDTLWKEGHCSRGTAYAWFRRVMVLTPDEAHIFKQDIEGCKKLIALVEEKGPGTEFWQSWFNPGKRVKPGPSSKRRRRRRSKKSQAGGGP